MTTIQLVFFTIIGGFFNCLIVIVDDDCSFDAVRPRLVHVVNERLENIPTELSNKQLINTKSELFPSVNRMTFYKKARHVMG